MQPDSVAVPFEDLLADLRRRGFGIGLGEYKDVAKLLARWQGHDRTVLRNAIAGVLARNAEEIEQIRDAFDEWADAAPPKAAPPPPPPPRTWRTWLLIAIAFVAVSAGAAATWWHFHQKHATASKEQKVSEPPPSPPETSDAPTSPEPQLPEPPRKAAKEMPWIAAAFAAISALLVLAAMEAKKRQASWFGRYWRHVLAHEPGPHHYEPNVRRSAPPLPRSVIEEVAAILGRAQETDPMDGDVLDVEESLRLTLREGLAPHLKFKPPPGNVPVLILEDVSWQMRPWAAKVSYFARELKRQGVYVEHWYFAGDPLSVSRTPGGRRIDLETLAATRAGASLLVLSSGQSLATKSFDAFARLLRKWTYRTWIHPIGNAGYWRRDLESLPIRMWPMTRAGVHAAAVEISRKGETGIVPHAKSTRAVTAGDVERMKQLLALASHPTLALAEELRRRFAPEVPEEVFLFLGAEGVFYGETIAIPREQLRKLLAASALDPEREQNVRRYLLDVLRESRPPEESAAHLRWQLDEAVQRLKLDAKDEDAAQTLRKLAEGPLRDEVRNAGFDVAAGEPKSLPKTPPPALGKRPPLWAWPRLNATALMFAVLVPLIVFVMRGSAVRRGDPIPHLLGAYTLTESSVTGARGVPDNPDLYRNGQLLRRVSLREPLVIEPAQRGAWFDVRARLLQGNLAASYPLWVPGAKPPEWPDDDVTQRVLKIIAGVKDGTITRATPLDVFEMLKISAAVLREFKVSVPSTATTAGAVVDAVQKSMVDKALLASVVLRFATPAGQIIPDTAYVLSSGRQTYNGTSGVESYVQPGVYSVQVVSRTPYEPIAPITLQVGESVNRRIVLRPIESWGTDAISRLLLSMLGDLGVPRSKIVPSADLRRDLGLSNAQVHELLVNVETAFPFEDGEVTGRKFRTVGDLRTFLREQARVWVTLRFVSSSGQPVANVDYAVAGTSGVADKSGKALVALRPGASKIEYGQGQVEPIRVSGSDQVITLVVKMSDDAPVQQQEQRTLPAYVQQFIDRAIRNRDAVRCAEQPDCENVACVMELAIRAAAAGSCDEARSLTERALCEDGKAREAIRSANRDAVCTYLRKRVPPSGE